MKLAFSGEGRYPDFEKGYKLYKKRNRSGNILDEKTYRRVVRRYCSSMAEMLTQNGLVDFPNRIGSVAAAIITRKPRYRNGKFLGFGKQLWDGTFDGNLKAFGIVFLPRHEMRGSLRCYGFVANRRLFKKMKALYDGYDCPWAPLEFEDEMI